MSEWKLGDRHKLFGKVIAMGIRDGDPYRFFQSKDKSISLIPLACLKAEVE